MSYGLIFEIWNNVALEVPALLALIWVAAAIAKINQMSPTKRKAAQASSFESARPTVCA